MADFSPVQRKLMWKLALSGRLDETLSYPRKHGLAQPDWAELISEIPDPYQPLVPDPVLRPNLQRIRPLGFIYSIQPPEYVIDLIGCSPNAEDQGRHVGAYQEGVALIELFRKRWGIGDQTKAFPTILERDYLLEREAIQHVIDQIADLMKQQLAAKPPKVVLDWLGTAPKSDDALVAWHALANKVERHDERWRSHDLYFFSRSVHSGSQARRQLPLHLRPFWKVFRDRERAGIEREITSYRSLFVSTSPAAHSQPSADTLQ